MKYGVSLRWMAVTSFEIRCNDLTVVTDPYITECPYADLTWESVEQCNMILFVRFQLHLLDDSKTLLFQLLLLFLEYLFRLLDNVNASCLNH